MEGGLETPRPSVAAELERIFAPLPRPAPPAPDRPVTSGDALPQRQRRPWIAALIVFGFLVAAAGAIFLPSQLRPPQTQPRLPPVKSRPLISGQSRLAPPPATANPQAASRSPSRAASPAASPAPHKPTPAAARSSRRGTVEVRRAHCRAGATSAWCLRGAVAAADGQLRDAYATAIRAGVSRRTLEDIRDDWSRLRRRANKDPQLLIRGYGDLAQELRAEARRARYSE